jgi:hypothetical protein
MGKAAALLTTWLIACNMGKVLADLVTWLRIGEVMTTSLALADKTCFATLDGIVGMGFGLIGVTLGT